MGRSNNCSGQEIKPLFSSHAKQEIEEGKLKEYCRSRAYRVCKFIWLASTAITMFELSEDKRIIFSKLDCIMGDGGSDSLFSYFRWKKNKVENLQSKPLETKRASAYRLWIVIEILLIGYLIAKMIFYMILQVEFERLRAKVQLQYSPKVKSSISESATNYGPYNRCRQPAETIDLCPENGGRSCASLANFTQFMEMAGNPLYSQGGSTLIAFGTIALCLCSFSVVWLFVIYLKPLPNNLSAFLHDPLCERSLIRVEMMRIFEYVAASFQIEKLPSSRSRQESKLGIEIDNQKEKNRHHDRRQIGECSPKLIAKIWPMVDPANLHSLWHRCATILNGLVMPSLAVTSSVICSTLFLAIILAELLSRTQRRIGTILCGRANNFLAQLPPLEPQDLRAYQEYDDSFFGLLKLAIFNEAKYFYTPTTKVMIVESIVAIFVVAIFSSHSMSLYLFPTFDKLVWLNQIHRQIEHCNRELAKFGRHRRVRRNSFAEGLEEEIIEKLTATYVNFELFRRRQNAYRSLANVAIGTGIWVTALNLALSYFVASLEVSHSKTILLGVATYVVALVNLLIVSGALMAIQLDRIMRQVFRLVAISTHLNKISGRKVHPVIVLWRRQIVFGQAMKFLLLPNGLGMYQTFGQVFTCNAYLVGLWLIILLK